MRDQVEARRWDVQRFVILLVLDKESRNVVALPRAVHLLILLLLDESGELSDHLVLQLVQHTAFEERLEVLGTV